MDFIFSKTTFMELGITGALFYFLPKTSLCLYAAPVMIYLFYYSKKKPSKLVDVKNMKAAVYTQSNDFAVKLISVPSLSANEVLVKVRSGSINPVDYKLKINQIPFLRYFVSATVGRDFSGEIIDVGEKVTKFKIGEEVYGNAIGGSLQEYTVAKENHVARKAKNINFNEAAGIGLAGGTSLQSLKHFGNLTENHTVLVIGASGGCGSLAVQIAKSFGCTVYGVCSKRNVDLVKSLGCDVVVDYTKENFLEDLKGEKFDLIYDTVTSKDDEDQEKTFLQYLKPEGNWVAINSKNPIDFVRGMIGFEKRKNYHLLLFNWNTKDLEYLSNLVEERKLKPLSTEVYQLDEKSVNDAFNKLKSRRTIGKICFEI